MAKKAVSPLEPITEGQIGKIAELVTAKLRKKKKEFPDSTVVQSVLATSGEAVAQELFAVVRKYVDAASNLLTRSVSVNRTRSAKEALKATGRNLYLNDSVADVMPNGTAKETEVVFFKLDRYIDDNDLEKEYELRGLTPVDPFSLAAVNEADPAFADTYPNGTHWKDAKDSWCFAAFDRGGWSGSRYVRVSRFDDDWSDGWWFAGVRK